MGVVLNILKSGVVLLLFPVVFEQAAVPASGGCYVFSKSKPFGLRFFSLIRIAFSGGVNNRTGAGEFQLPYMLVQKEGGKAVYHAVLPPDISGKEQRVLRDVLILDLSRSENPAEMFLRFVRDGDAVGQGEIMKMLRRKDGRWVYRAPAFSDLALIYGTKYETDAGKLRFPRALTLVIKGKVIFMPVDDSGRRYLFFDLSLLNLKTLYPYSEENGQLILHHAGKSVASEDLADRVSGGGAGKCGASF